MKYRENRVLHAGDVRRMCIEHNYYNAGTNTQYEKMLNSVPEEYITMDDLLIIASDILSHTSNEDDVTLETIYFDLCNKCYTFLEIEE